MKTRRLIWNLAVFKPWLFVLTSGCWTLSLVFLMVPGLIVREFFEVLTEDARVNLGIWGLIALLVASGMGRATGFFGGMTLNTIFFYTFGALLRKNLFEHILQCPGTHAVLDSAGEAISRFRGDVDEIIAYLRQFIPLMTWFVCTPIALVVMMRINPLVTLIVCLPLAGIVTAVHVASKHIAKYRRVSRETTGRVTSFLGEIFDAIQAVKVATAEAHVTDYFHTLSEMRRKAALKDRLFNELMESLYWHPVNLGIGVILLLVGPSMQAGTFTVGDFALFVYYLPWIIEPAHALAISLTHYKQIKVSFERLVELLGGAPPETLVHHGPVYLRGAFPDVPYIPKTDTHRLVKLEASGLTYHYPDTGRGIERIDLTLEHGTLTVITGRIGTGKTTLLRVLLGLLPKDAGEIRCNGEIVEDPASFFVPPQSSYTPQVPRMFSDTLRDNILMGLPEDKVDLLAAIRSAVMEQDLMEMEKGLDTVVGPRGVRLSGGQIQRTSAARMFVRDPELLVFDDLSSALDVETERTLWERIFERREATYLVVSHRRAALCRADHIIVLKNGRIEAEGRLEDLLESCEEVQRLWKGDLGTT